jgi:hypothetical protein
MTLSGMSFFDVNHRAFRPLWIRVLIVAVILGWTAVEMRGGNMGWAMIFGAAGLYLAWAFFVTFRPPDDGEGAP